MADHLSPRAFKSGEHCFYEEQAVYMVEALVSELDEPSDFSAWGKSRLGKKKGKLTSQVNMSELNPLISYVFWVSWSGADCKRLIGL